jgi:hypothetical protein
VHLKGCGRTHNPPVVPVLFIEVLKLPKVALKARLGIVWIIKKGGIAHASTGYSMDTGFLQ